MSTKPCLFDKPLTGAQKQARWRAAHPEHRDNHTVYVRNWRKKRKLIEK